MAFRIIISIAPATALETIQKELSGYSFSTYSLGVTLADPEMKRAELQKLKSKLAENDFFKNKKFVHDFPDVQVVIDWVKNKMELTIFPVILKVRYRKLQRGIAQTRHFCYQCKGRGVQFGKVCDICKGEKVTTKESVQELIFPFFKKSFQCREMLFHGAGREDVDVLMLGNGRPFALSLENPLVREVDLDALEREMNAHLKGKVELLGLSYGLASDVEAITQAYHTKRYRALVSSTEKIIPSALDAFIGKKMDVLQTTPTRVEKRRSMKERPHWVVVEKVIPKSPYELEIFIHTSAGCYVKEFISSDNGRSVPSIAQWLGIACVCKELDVLEIVDV